MPVTVTPYNYAEVRSATPSTDPATFDTTWTCRYVVGYKPSSGPIVYYSHPTVQGCAKGLTVTVTCAAALTAQQQYQAILQAIAAQEGLNPAAGDTLTFGS